jgi:hypothetical protein
MAVTRSRFSAPHCEGVVIVHFDGTRTCSLDGCLTEGSLRDHSTFASCREAVGTGCPRCSEPDN